MRRFTSYGPVERNNFGVERRPLVEQCVEQLVGQTDEPGGHYFTIWGPRQTGKTWIMRRAVEEIRARYKDQFVTGVMTLQGVIGDENEQRDESFLDVVPELFRNAFDMQIPTPQTWGDWRKLFERKAGLFDRPVLLLLDEFDSLPAALIDRLVAQFRKMYLDRNAYWLHGLALIGVRSVLGVDSPRGSPFNVQRSLKIPKLTHDEVAEMFAQYQQESGQVVEPGVVEALYEATRGQPGLVGWFGELITEKYNPGNDKPITLDEWDMVYSRALSVEWNNTLLNFGKKARGPYQPQVMRLFTDPNVPFAMEQDWCSYLYMNGLIEETFIPDPEHPNRKQAVCRFSCPFVQMRLYSGFTTTMFGDKGPILPLDITDSLADVFTAEGIQTPKLLERYRAYLKRLKTKGIDPWIGQPRRQDLQYTEAVGHFHLYAWLQNALLGQTCSVSPEFPTGNGKVDLVLRKNDRTAVIEVKSLSTLAQLAAHRSQAAGYARKLGLNVATLVVFAPVDDESVLDQLAGVHNEDGVTVTTVPFGWV